MELATHFCEFNYPSTCQAFILSTCQPFVLSFYLAIHLPLPLFPCKLHGTWNSCGLIQLSTYTYLFIYLATYLSTYFYSPCKLHGTGNSFGWISLYPLYLSTYLSSYLAILLPTYTYIPLVNSVELGTHLVESLSGVLSPGPGPTWGQGAIYMQHY